VIHYSTPGFGWGSPPGNRIAVATLDWRGSKAMAGCPSTALGYLFMERLPHSDAVQPRQTARHPWPTARSALSSLHARKRGLARAAEGAPCIKTFAKLGKCHPRRNPVGFREPEVVPKNPINQGKLLSIHAGIRYLTIRGIRYLTACE
jgi:hypothetical protein